MMHSYPEPMTRLISELTKLPGVGEKTSERLAFYLLKAGTEEALKLAVAINDVKKKIHPCKNCFNISEMEYCWICREEKRDSSIICVVEQPKDLIAFEKAKGYNGLYHVLMGHLAPLDGVGPNDLTIQELFERVRKGNVREVILATNPDMEGDATALYIARGLQETEVRVTRIAKGIPSGSNIEYASNAILFDALSGRKEFGTRPFEEDREAEGKRKLDSKE